MAKKVHEQKNNTINNNTKEDKKNKKLEKINVEIIQDKINIFNEVDSFILNKSIG